MPHPRTTHLGKIGQSHAPGFLHLAEDHVPVFAVHGAPLPDPAFHRATHAVGHFVVSATASISCEKGSAITGLPFAASDYSSDVKVTNITTQTELGGAYVDGGKLCLPAIRLGTDKIVITATYFSA